jgi:GGDEF domain-containing protein
MTTGARIPHFGTLRRIARMMQISQLAALALLLGLGALLWHNIADFRNADAWVDHTHDVQEEIDRVRATVMLGGLALRNYAIAPQPEFLESLSRASFESQDASERLQGLVEDNPSQYARANEVHAETREIVGWYRSSGVIAQRDGAAALQASLAARVNIDASQRLRKLLDVMDTEERTLLEVRREARELGFQSVKRWSAAIGLVFVLFTAGAIVHAGRLVGLGESNLKTLHADAEKDPLTALANRRAIDRAAQAQVGRPMAVISFDLDDFKPVNDRHGHAAGDQVLRTVAARPGGCEGAGGHRRARAQHGGRDHRLRRRGAEGRSLGGVRVFGRQPAVRAAGGAGGCDVLRREEAAKGSAGVNCCAQRSTVAPRVGRLVSPVVRRACNACAELSNT